SPRLTLDSLEGTPVGACWPAQKDASASRSRYMAVLPCLATRDRIVASTAVGCQLIFRQLPHTGQASVAPAMRQMSMFSGVSTMHISACRTKDAEAYSTHIFRALVQNSPRCSGAGGLTGVVRQADLCELICRSSPG